MNKIIMTMISIIVIISAVITAVIIFKPNEQPQEQTEMAKTQEEEIILDDCTDEYEYQQSETLKTNAKEEEKTSPNCSVTWQTTYTKCGHTIKEYNNLPENLVNKTQEEMETIYQDWKIEKFASNQIILSCEENGQCDQHYIIRDVDGKIIINKILENGEEEEYEKTEISTEYIPQTDKINMENGIKVYGKTELNQLIEDFE